MIYSTYACSFHFASFFTGVFIGSLFPMGYIYLQTFSPNYLQKTTINSAYNVLYLMSYAQIQFNRLSRWIRSFHPNKNASTNGVQYKIEYVKQGYVIHQHSGTVVSNSMECGSDFVTYGDAIECVNADFMIYSVLGSDFVVNGVRNDSNQIWLKKVCEVEMVPTTLEKTTECGDCETSVEDAGIQFIGVELVINDTHIYPIMLKTDEYNYYTVGSILHKPFMMYYLIHHVDLTREERNELDALYLHGNWCLNIIDHEVNQLSIHLHNEERITFLKDGGYSLTYETMGCGN